MEESKRDFSELAKSYNKNAFLLNDARKVFESELRRLNDLVGDSLETTIDRINKDESCNWRTKWAGIEDKSSQKEGPWLNFCTRTETSLTVKNPIYKNFRKNVAYLIFEVVFDWEGTNQFIFRCRFENQNIVSESLDEKLIELAQRKGDKFSGCQHFKASTAIVFKKELNAELLENMNLLINETLDLVCEMVGEVFPKELYKKEDMVVKEEEGIVMPTNIEEGMFDGEIKI